MALHRTSTCESVSHDVSNLSVKENLVPTKVGPEYVYATRTTRSRLRLTVVLQDEQAGGALVATLPSTGSIRVSGRKGKAKADIIPKKTVSSTSKKARNAKPTPSPSSTRGKQKAPCPFQDAGCLGEFTPTGHDCRRHMQIHRWSWEREFRCARYFRNCVYTAVQESNLKTHIKSHHKNTDSSLPCRAILQKDGLDGRPWVCNYLCSSGKRKTHWSNTHGTTEPETFDGRWFDARFCSIEEYYQYHGRTPPMNCKSGYKFSAGSQKYSGAVIDAAIAAYGGKEVSDLKKLDKWVKETLGYKPEIDPGNGGEVEDEEDEDELEDDAESEETPVFYMDAEVSPSPEHHEAVDIDIDDNETVSDDRCDYIPEGPSITRSPVPAMPGGYGLATWPPPPPPLGYAGPWEEFPKECAHHVEFKRLGWMVEDHTAEDSYEIHRQAYHDHQKSLVPPQASPAIPQQHIPSLIPPSWTAQQHAPAPSYDDYSAPWGSYSETLPASPYTAHYAALSPQGYFAPPPSHAYPQPYYMPEVQNPIDYSDFAYPVYAPGPVAGSSARQYQYPPAVLSGWSSQYTSPTSTRQPSPARSNDEKAAAEALLGLGSSK